MPARVGHIKRMEQMTLEERIGTDGEFQKPWYEIAATYVKDQTVLDVGAGTGYGMRIMREQGHAFQVTGIDPLPAHETVGNGPIEWFKAKSFDWVTCMDVIEHVDDDVGLLRHLFRIARKGVFLSTPNWDRFHAQNEYHLREYTLGELKQLFGNVFSQVECFNLFFGGDTPTIIAPHRVLLWEELAGCSNFGVCAHLAKTTESSEVFRLRPQAPAEK